VGRDQVVQVVSSPVAHDLAVRVDSNRGDHAQVAQVVFRQPVHDRVVPRLNAPAANDLAAEVRARNPANRVQEGRVDLLPESNDLAAEAQPISNLAVSSICRVTVILVAKDPLSIADSNDLAARGLGGRMKASESPNDVTGCPTGGRNRLRTEQTG
jgi:hypothetical protein